MSDLIITSTPLITIEFMGDEPAVTLVRHWYHVPRVGDYVELADSAERAINGKVDKVVWSGGQTVECYVRSSR